MQEFIAKNGEEIAESKCADTNVPFSIQVCRDDHAREHRRAVSRFVGN
jgi:hypothetical protein